MFTATVRFYEELNDFFPKNRRQVDFQVTFKEQRSVKDLIESLGVPHTEVDLILRGGESVDFNYLVRQDDRFSVYPVFELLNIQNVSRLRSLPLRKTAFITTIDLSSLARYLRALGFDVVLDKSLTAGRLVKLAKEDKRIILTKSKKLLMYKEVTHAIFLRSNKIEQQLSQVIDYLDIKGEINLFSRCLYCNSKLKKISKEKIIDRLPLKVKAAFSDFSYCKKCDKVYWQGSHCQHVQRVMHDSLSL